MSEELTPKQRAFIAHYLACLNATEAAARAGYEGSRPTLASVGYENLRKPEIRAELDRQLAEVTMPPAEILARLTAHARGDIGELLTPSGKGVRIDLKRAKEAGLTHLIKSYSKTKEGVRVELYDAQAALRTLGEHYKLWGRGADFLKLIDLSRLSDEQLERLAAGEDPIKVLMG